MNLSEEQLNEVEALAYRLLPPHDIAIVIEVTPLDLCEAINDDATPAHRAFYRGYLKQVVEQRDAIIKAAQNGSNPAQEEIMRFIHQLENRLRYG